MNTLAKVISTKEGIAHLEVRKQSSCGTHCASCSASCSQKSMRIDVINDLHVKPGDFVELSTDNRQVLKYTSMIYGIPLAFLFMGFSLSYSLLSKYGVTNYELLSLLIGFLFLGLGACLNRWMDKRRHFRSENLNHMTRKL